jgi:hypothetical protein
MDDDTWVSHNYGELIADAIANNGGAPDAILHDLVAANGDGAPKPTFLSFEREPTELPDCSVRAPDHSMVWRREVAATLRATTWTRVRGLLRFQERRPSAVQ